PAHGAADHGRPGIDTKGIDEGLFGAYGVPDGQPRKTTAPGTPVRPRGGRSRTSLAATQGVGGHHEVAVGVQGTTGTDQTVPPPRGGMPGLGRTGDMGVTGQGVQHQHGVAAVGGQTPPGLVGQPHIGQFHTGFQGQGAVEEDPAAPPRGVSLLPRSAGRTRPGLAPALAKCSGASWLCVVLAGCTMRLRTSPMFTSWLKSSVPSTKARPASTPPCNSKETTAPAPLGMYFCACWW